MRPTPGLAALLDGWAPVPVSSTQRLERWPLDAFAGLLDAVAPGEKLPALWHWFSFLEHPPQSSLGPDGHPADGHFLPPIPERHRMAAGGRYRQRVALRVGDTVTRRSELAGVDVKQGRGGELAFVTVRHEFHRAGELLAVEEQDLVYRQQAAGPPRRERADAPPAEWELRLRPDPVLLFRFSALTANAHRIHYDHPYTTGPAGYPGLVVHGPLLALLALELPRRYAPGAVVSEFAYRLQRPAFAGADLVALGTRDLGTGNGDAAALQVGVAGEAASLTATARLEEDR